MINVELWAIILWRSPAAVSCFLGGDPRPSQASIPSARSSLNHTNPTHTTDTARRPHVYTNGNHEGSGQWKPYTEFTQRLAFGQGKLANASQSTSVRWSAWETGPVAWIALDPDAYIYPLVYNLLDAQYAWLKAALQRVNRTRTPWLVFLVHRAAYCTKSTDGECNSEAETLRKGQLGVRAPLETLLQQYGVDFYFSGHTHHYERTWPVLAGAATAQHYVNPRATIHIQSGIAGTGPGDMFVVPQEPWEAFRDELYVPSYGRLVFHNESAATYYVRFVCFAPPPSLIAKNAHLPDNSPTRCSNFLTTMGPCMTASRFHRQHMALFDIKIGAIKVVVYILFSSSLTTPSRPPPLPPLQSATPCCFLAPRAPPRPKLLALQRQAAAPLRAAIATLPPPLPPPPQQQQAFLPLCH